MEPFRKVLLVASLTPGYVENVIRGVGLFARPRHRWLFELVEPSARALAQRCRAGADGAIVLTMTAQVADVLRRAGMPAVNGGVRPLAPDFPHVGNDDAAIGEQAARHFLNRGFTRFAYVGLTDPTASFVPARRDGFVLAARQAGHGVAVREMDSSLARWLKTLEQPVAVMACNDAVAWQVAEACRAAELRVPEQVALIGVDDDQALCHLAYPPLSSIAAAAERIGAKAAALLARLMAGERADGVAVEVPPLGVVIRQSSDIFAVTDPDVAEALHFIDRRAAGPLHVKEIAAHVALGRRTLEQRFLAALGRSPYEEVQRVRLERAKELLVRTTLPLSEIARRCGFGAGKRLSIAVRQSQGTTPSSLRRAARVSDIARCRTTVRRTADDG